MTFRLGLPMQLLREHRTRDGIADFSGGLFHIDELCSPRRAALWTVHFLVQFRRDRLDPIS